MCSSYMNHWVIVTGLFPQNSAYSFWSKPKFIVLNVYAHIHMTHRTAETSHTPIIHKHRQVLSMYTQIYTYTHTAKPVLSERVWRNKE